MMETPSDAPRLDRATLLAAGVSAYLFQAAAHELLGHAGTGVLLGEHPYFASSTYVFTTAESALHLRLICAGGTATNLLLGLAALAALSLARGASATLRYVLWVWAVVNVLIATGYLAVASAFLNGDWGAFLQGFGGLGPAWRFGFVAAGALAYVLFTKKVAAPALEPLLGAGSREMRRARARELCLVPYVAGGVLLSISAGISPIRAAIMNGIMTAFAGTFLLVKVPSMVGDAPGGAGPPPSIERSRPLVAFAAALVALHLFWLGPGVILSPVPKGVTDVPPEIAAVYSAAAARKERLLAPARRR